MRTTININTELKETLKISAQSINIPLNKLIIILLERAELKNIFKVKGFKSVQYQKKDPNKNWSRLHLSFEPQIYEKTLDFRKFFKVSVSLLISIAANIFLDELLNEINNSRKNEKMMDNYPPNYIFIAKMFDNIQGFTILWGIPKEDDLKQLLP